MNKLLQAGGSAMAASACLATLANGGGLAASEQSCCLADAWTAAHTASAPSTTTTSTQCPALLPAGWGAKEQRLFPFHAGIGFIDVVQLPGNTAASFPGAAMAQWRDHMFARLRLSTAAAASGLLQLQHETGAAAGAGAAAAGVPKCAAQHLCEACSGWWPGRCSGAPAHVLFSGKRHFEALFHGSGKR